MISALGSPGPDGAGGAQERATDWRNWPIRFWRVGPHLIWCAEQAPVVAEEVSVSCVARRLWRSAAWRAGIIRRALYSVEDVAFWAGESGGAPWYPDLDRLAEIGRATGFRARTTTPEDLGLLRTYHDRAGRPLGPRRVRRMRERWAQGSECYIATDRHGDVVAYMWAGYQDHYVESIGEVLPVTPSEILHFDVDTRPDRRGSMGFLACACASLADGVRRGRRRVISWGPPEVFEEFRRFHWWTGLGALYLMRVVRCTRVLGMRFRRTVDSEEASPTEEEPRVDR